MQTLEMTNYHNILTELVKRILSGESSLGALLPTIKAGGAVVLSPTTEAAITATEAQIKALERERVEKLEHVYLVAWGIVHTNHSTAAVQEDEMDSCTNPDCQRIQAALAELEK